jgi:hypothetical protein
MVYLLNAPILTAYGTWQFQGPISASDARARIHGQTVISAIGHKASSNLLSKILQQPVDPNRIAVQLQPGDSALVFRLLQRLPEGTVLDVAQLKATPYELGWLHHVSEATE